MLVSLRMMSLRRSRSRIIAAAAILPFVGALSQAHASAVVEASNYPAPRAYPNERRDVVAEHLSAARREAGTDLFADMAHRCIISPVFPQRVAGIQFNGKIPPTRIFDNFYSIGQNEVSAFALTTSDGIVIIDSLNNEDEARNLLVPNMVALGLDPKRIRSVIVSHAHGDHYGGAAYLQRTYGAKVIASAIDWAEMRKAVAEPGPFHDLPIPEHDIDMPDGGSLTLGGTTIRFYVTPGHTPGVLSLIFAVTDQGRPHVVGFFGGTGSGSTPDALRQQIASLERWHGLARDAKVDVNVTNHPLHDEGLEREELVRYRRKGDSNPFVLGKETYLRYVRVQEECAKVQLGRFGYER